MEVQEKVRDIILDKKIPIKLGRKEYKIRYLKTWTSDRIASVLVDMECNLLTDDEMDIKKVAMSGTAPSKVLSYAILGSYFKIKLFHWIFWRYLYRSKTSTDMAKGLFETLKAMDVHSFLESIQLAATMNTMRMRQMKEVLQGSSQAKQSQEKGKATETN